MSENMLSDALDVNGSEARYLSIIEGETELICRYLPDGRLSFVNEAYARYYGKERRKILNTNFIPEIPQPDLAMILDRINQITPDASTADFEHRVIMPDGAVRWQHWVHRGIYSSGGELLEHQAVGRDITERKRLEYALKESEQRYRTLFENSRDGFVVVDKTGRFLDANSAYCEMVGYTLDELRRMENFFEITPEIWHDWERDEIWFKRLFKTGSSGVYEKEYIRKNGEIFPVELNSFTIFGEDGSPFNLWGIARDITLRKQAEAEKEELMNELADALYRLKILSGIIPICSYCKKIRNDQGYWEQLETYITNHSEALFSHCMCADCAKKAYEELDRFREMNKRM